MDGSTGLTVCRSVHQSGNISLIIIQVTTKLCANICDCPMMKPQWFWGSPDFSCGATMTFTFLFNYFLKQFDCQEILCRHLRGFIPGQVEVFNNSSGISWNQNGLLNNISSSATLRFTSTALVKMSRANVAAKSGADVQVPLKIKSKSSHHQAEFSTSTKHPQISDTHISLALCYW